MGATNMKKLIARISTFNLQAVAGAPCQPSAGPLSLWISPAHEFVGQAVAAAHGATSPAPYRIESTQVVESRVDGQEGCKMLPENCLQPKLTQPHVRQVGY